MKTPQYDLEARKKRALQYAEHLSKLVDLKGKRVLEVGPQLGDLSIVLARDYGCEVVGIDQQAHDNWGEVQDQYPNIKFIQGDIADLSTGFEDNSFDLIVSFVVWEHVRHPWSALSNCQRVLKPGGKKFIRANLYRSSIASHLYGRITEPWPHLMRSADEIKSHFKIPLGWAFWVNKLTYQQYLFYFRQLGFYITHEKLTQVHFNREFYDANEHKLGLYPEWDLKTDFFEVVLEFDPAKPKQPVADPVYARMPKP